MVIYPNLKLKIQQIKNKRMLDIITYVILYNISISNQINKKNILINRITTICRWRYVH